MGRLTPIRIGDYMFIQRIEDNIDDFNCLKCKMIGVDVNIHAKALQIVAGLLKNLLSENRSLMNWNRRFPVSLASSICFN